MAGVGGERRRRATGDCDGRLRRATGDGRLRRGRRRATNDGDGDRDERPLAPARHRCAMALAGAAHFIARVGSLVNP